MLKHKTRIVDTTLHKAGTAQNLPIPVAAVQDKRTDM